MGKRRGFIRRGQWADYFDYLEDKGKYDPSRAGEFAQAEREKRAVKEAKIVAKEEKEAVRREKEVLRREEQDKRWAEEYASRRTATEEQREENKGAAKSRSKKKTKKPLKGKAGKKKGSWGLSRSPRDYVRRYKLRTNPTSLYKTVLPIAGWYLGSKIVTNLIAPSNISKLAAVGMSVGVCFLAYMITTKSVIGTGLNIVDTVIL